jgi:KDO2-lipid IV(A) lauroyltransferase
MVKLRKAGKRNRFLKILSGITEAILLQLLWWLVALQSPEDASAFGRRLWSWLGPRLEKNRHILANVRTAFPDKTPEDHYQLTREIWGSFGSVLAEYACLDKLVDTDRPNPYVELVYRYGDGSVLTDDVPRIYFSAHIGNWELGTLPAKHFRRIPSTLYTPQNNPLLERMLQRKREPLGISFSQKVNGMRALYQSIKKGESIGLLADVRVDSGPAVPFLGHDAHSTPAIAWLSLKTHAEIVPIQTERLSDAHYRVTVHPGFRAELQEGETEKQAIKRVTADIAKIVEGWVLKDPGQWWCNARRWPKKELMWKLGAYDL